MEHAWWSAPAWIDADANSNAANDGSSSSSYTYNYGTTGMDTMTLG